VRTQLLALVAAVVVVLQAMAAVCITMPAMPLRQQQVAMA
jgi:hypothetical protein